MIAITADEFEILTDWIYRKTGIRYEVKKRYFLTKRIEKRMDALGLTSVTEYIRTLRFADPRSQELQRLIDLLTINETYFFRDFSQLQAFGEHCLMEIVAGKAEAGERRLRVWSAGCSTGEEPYTLGIIIREMVDDIDAWEVTIEAGDIDRSVLEKARAGIYEPRSLRDLPAVYLERYFHKLPNDTYRINKTIRDMVTFEHINLSDKVAIRQKRGFDFIFCRNLLIYFDDVSRKRLVDQLYVALNPSGYIFLGASESIGRISTAFRIKRMGGYIVYCK